MFIRLPSLAPIWLPTPKAICTAKPCQRSLSLQYSISKNGWPHGLGHTVIALHTVIRYTRIFGWIWGEHGIWQSSDRIWACSRLCFSRKNCNLGFWKPLFGFWKLSESIGACSRQFFSPRKWQSRILEGLHTFIAYPHGYLVHGYCIAHGYCVPTPLLGTRLLT